MTIQQAFYNAAPNKKIAEVAIDNVEYRAELGRDIVSKSALVAEYRNIERQLAVSNNPLREQFSGLNKE